jgi:hypothetical protein
MLPVQLPSNITAVPTQITAGPMRQQRHHIYYMVPVNNSQYDYSFKFNGAADNKTADIKVDFSGASGAYTHSVKVN